MKPTIELLDVCLSDYFRGFNGDVFCVAVTGDSTVGDVREGLLEDVQQWDGWLRQADRQCTAEEWAELDRAVEALFEDADPEAVCFPTVPGDDEYRDEHGEIDETPYAYFGVRWTED